MSFRCQSCRDVRPHGEASHRVVVERREHVHPFRPEVNRVPWGDWTDDPGGKGTQIVRETVVCAACLGT